MMDVLEPKARITTPPPYTHSYIRHKGYPMQEEEDDEEDTIKTTFINEPLFYDNTFKPHTNKKRRRGNLPKNVTEYLRQWLILHKKHPYPTEKEKQQLALETGLMVNQISNWFINARRRILQPMLESENRQLKISKDSRYYAEEDYLKGNNGYYYLDSSSDRGKYI
ncbi:homeobox KN domain-containing protein [Pilobolus umbonatus]|nr:homeobox KN domain-containing protein [Pilobolus umbonatus]